MRIPVAIAMICVGAVMISCGESDGNIQSFERDVSGTVIVYVYWDGNGLPDKRVEVVELGVEMTTDEAGVAEFEVPPGDYTVRAYEINVGGPGLSHLDTKVTVPAGQTIRVEIVDCLPCV